MLPKYEALVKEAVLKQNDVDAIRLCGQLLTLNHHIIEKCNQNLNNFNVAEGSFVILLLLNDLGDSLPSQLAEKAGITRSAVTSVIDFLEKNSYASRMPSSTDRRSQIIHLEEVGKELLNQILDLQLSWLESLTTSLKPKEKLQLANLLEKVSTNTLRKAITNPRINL